jgi:2-oxoacid:acceptor oxidoreductase gamma subunit (pyruvate/2-ketoisovalerate family)
MLELRINGFGGQGSVTLAHLLAQAALENGQQGQALPFFGVERRGAPVRAAVRISPTTIHAHSQCDLPDYVVVMSEKLITAAVREGINDSGSVIVNAPKAVMVQNHPTWQIDADSIAREKGLFSADGPDDQYSAVWRGVPGPEHPAKYHGANHFEQMAREWQVQPGSGCRSL